MSLSRTVSAANLTDNPDCLTVMLKKSIITNALHTLKLTHLLIVTPFKNDH